MPTRLADGLGLEVPYKSKLSIRPGPPSVATIFGSPALRVTLACGAQLRLTNYRPGNTTCKSPNLSKTKNGDCPSLELIASSTKSEFDAEARTTLDPMLDSSSRWLLEAQRRDASALLNSRRYVRHPDDLVAPTQFFQRRVETS